MSDNNILQPRAIPVNPLTKPLLPNKYNKFWLMDIK